MIMTQPYGDSSIHAIEALRDQLKAEGAVLFDGTESLAKKYAFNFLLERDEVKFKIFPTETGNHYEVRLK